MEYEKGYFEKHEKKPERVYKPPEKVVKPASHIKTKNKVSRKISLVNKETRIKIDSNLRKYEAILQKVKDERLKLIEEKADLEYKKPYAETTGYIKGYRQGIKDGFFLLMQSAKIYDVNDLKEPGQLS